MERVSIMSVYVTSDLHGLELCKLKELLEKAGFGDDDWLYILGDAVDRQNDGGVEILKWLLEQPNAQLILGNHEAMLLSCEFLFGEITEERIEALDKEKMGLVMTYMQNGGDVTLDALRKLMKSSPETVSYIMEYLHDAPLYETVSAGGRDFLLVHSGLDNFDKSRKITDYSPDELLWAWPTADDEYYDGIVTVFGHTPTVSYGKEHKGRILRTRTWIDVDVGVPYGNSPALLRLDDLEEIYL